MNVMQVQDNGKFSAPKGQPQRALSASESTMHTGDDRKVVANIRATDVALRLKRVPAGFYTVVYHSGLEWRTDTKRSSMNGDVVEWSEPVLLPSDLTATVSLEVYATFEFQPVLGDGEQLRKLTITVEQLLDHSVNYIRERVTVCKVWVLIPWQRSISLHWMETLYPRAHLFLSPSNDIGIRAVMRLRRGSLAPINNRIPGRTRKCDESWP
ncbi:hypothetical protein EV363DRAFT_291323 [Boletus edulis]|nr:hypothetical protein EV363DRAFT_291323 [Boletus edulis]